MSNAEQNEGHQSNNQHRSLQRVSDEKPENFIPYESPKMASQDRFNDEPEPTQDDMIVTHYFKHHPLFEFRDLEDHHVDNYRHWLHARAEYYNTETYPAEISHWEKGNKFNHTLILLFPLFSFVFFGN